MLSQLVSRIAHKIRRVTRNPTTRYSRFFNNDKKWLIDFTLQRLTPQVRTFADIGGIWNVDGAYTFYALDEYPIEAAYIVDTDFTERVVEKSVKYPQLTCVAGNFGEPSIIDKVGSVDAIFLFDVLLHQVDPNWDQILEIYSRKTRCFLIFNPQYINGERTVRLLDMGIDEYFKNVPHDRSHPTYTALVDKMYQINPKYHRLWRDIPDVWQWGITDTELCSVMKSLGFTLEYYMNCGRFLALENFENHMFAFRRRRRI